MALHRIEPILGSLFSPVILTCFCFPILSTYRKNEPTATSKRDFVVSISVLLAERSLRRLSYFTFLDSLHPASRASSIHLTVSGILLLLFIWVFCAHKRLRFLPLSVG